MTHLLRGKQAGVQGDFSAGLGPDLFAIDEVQATSIVSATTEFLSN